MPANPDILTYYAGLLIVQYKKKDKAAKTIKLLVNQAICDGLIEAERDCFILDDAIGAQLDIIGRIVGVPRNVYGLDFGRNYHNFTRYGTSHSSIGFCRYDQDPYPDAYLFLRYRFLMQAFYAMTNYELRVLIRLKIELNTKRCTVKNIVDMMHTYFPSQIEFVDNKDMTADYNISTDIEHLGQIAEFMGFLPKPMGVDVTVNYV